MKALLIGGPLDGQTVKADDGASSITSQKSDLYVKALSGEGFAVFVTADIPRDHMVPLLAKKLAEGYNLRNHVGMALAQLDDAVMYLERTGETAAEKAVLKARRILNHG